MIYFSVTAFSGPWIWTFLVYVSAKGFSAVRKTAEFSSGLSYASDFDRSLQRPAFLAVASRAVSDFYSGDGIGKQRACAAFWRSWRWTVWALTCGRFSVLKKDYSLDFPAFAHSAFRPDRFFSFS